MTTTNTDAPKHPATVTLRGRVYAVTARPSEVMPYRLTGPRGGEFLVIRNVNSLRLHVVAERKNGTLDGVVLDDRSEPGAFRVVCG